MTTAIKPAAEQPATDLPEALSAAPAATSCVQRQKAILALRLGMRFSPTLPFDQWVRIGARVAAHEDASAWWLGDWLNYGKAKYGATYQRGLELTGLEYETLRNYAMVARRFELSRRRDKLSFQHHAEVCALPNDQQDRWLDLAEAERWSRSELRRRLQAESPTRRAETLRLAVDPERAARWSAAARESGSELKRWILDTLDQEAHRLEAAD